MADELSARTRLLDELLETLQFIDHRFPCLVTLLHGRNHNLVDSWRLYHLAFRKLAVEKRQFIESDFRSLLRHPLDALHHLGRSNRQMDMALPGTLLRHCFLDFIETALAGSRSHLGTIERTFPIHEENLVTALQSQHTERMGSLLGRQFHLGCCLRHIEISNLFHRNIKSLSLKYLISFLKYLISLCYFLFFSSRRFISSRMKEAPS